MESDAEGIHQHSGFKKIAEIELCPSQLEAAMRIVHDSDDLVAALQTKVPNGRLLRVCHRPTT